MAEPLQLALKSALATGNIQTAIAEHQAGLTVHDREVLQGITAADLGELKRLEDLARAKKGMPNIGGINPALAAKGDWIGGIW